MKPDTNSHPTTLETPLFKTVVGDPVQISAYEVSNRALHTLPHPTPRVLLFYLGSFVDDNANKSPYLSHTVPTNLRTTTGTL